MAKLLKTAVLCVLALFLTVSASSCRSSGTELRNGYYTAIMEDFDKYGWKDFLVIYVRDGLIVSAEFNSKNESGFVKSWDMEYMRSMKPGSGTYPNEFARMFADDLMTSQDPSRIDAVTGATDSYNNFKLLAEAAVEMARTGSSGIAYVRS